MALLIANHNAMQGMTSLLDRMSQNGFNVEEVEIDRWNACAATKGEHYKSQADINLYAGTAALFLSLAAVAARAKGFNADMIDTAARNGTQFGKDYYSIHEQERTQKWQHEEDGARRDLQQKEEWVRSMEQMRTRAENARHENNQLLAQAMRITSVNA